MPWRCPYFTLCLACYWSHIKRAYLAFEWNAKRSELVPRSCESLSKSLQQLLAKLYPLHTVSPCYKKHHTHIKLSSNTFYLKLLGTGTSLIVTWYSWGNKHRKAQSNRSVTQLFVRSFSQLRIIWFNEGKMAANKLNTTTWANSRGSQ